MEDKGDECEAPTRRSITKEMLAKMTASARRSSSDSLNKHLAKVTHLQLEDKNLDVILEPETSSQSPLPLCTNLRTVYLAGNHLRSLAGLQFAQLCTHLYAQRNLLQGIQLEGMRSLQKLYLDGNNIKVVGGFPGVRLQELHLNSQGREEGQTITFSPEAIESLAPCLQTLSLSNNRLQDPSELNMLFSLRKLNLSLNNIESLELVLDLVCALQGLQELDLRDNPVQKVKKYRDSVIMLGQSLQMLDGKKVGAGARQFLLGKRANSRGQIKPNSRPGSRASGSEVNPYSSVIGGGGVSGMRANKPLNQTKVAGTGGNLRAGPRRGSGQDMRIGPAEEGRLPIGVRPPQQGGYGYPPGGHGEQSF